MEANMGKHASKGKKVIIIAGPTASGKSALALEVALRFNGYIVNADAMQVYKDLPILSAQPSEEAQALRPHFLYGLLPLDEACSAMNWAERAKATIKTTDGLPILTGGTGLYLRALLEGLSPVPDIPFTIQQEGREILAEEKGPGLHRILHNLDPIMAGRLHPNDSHRILRAYCVFRATGQSLAGWQKISSPPSEFDPLYFVLLPDRSALYEKCNQRFYQMMMAGALEEVQSVLLQYPQEDFSLPGFKTLGFRELASYVQSKITLQDAIAAAQQHTRNYAKRQVTWFSHQLTNSNKIANLYENMKLQESIAAEIFSKINGFLLT